MVREERQRWVALGVSRVRESEAIGALGLSEAVLQGKILILQHATAHANMMAEARELSGPSQLEPERENRTKWSSGT